MSTSANKLLREIAREQEQLQNVLPALDDILLFALERRYLDVGKFQQIMLEQEDTLQPTDTVEILRKNVRFLKVDEVTYSRDSKFHLSGVENTLSSMRNCGHSLLFLLEGEADRANVYLGLSQFVAEPALPLDEALEAYQAAWRSNFPGGSTQRVSEDVVRQISAGIGRSKHCGFMTGMPSLKRDEDRYDFVQGLERLIRALRGKRYHWISIADPIDAMQIEESIRACHDLTGEIHQRVKTSLSKGLSKGQTVMAGMFGLMGSGKTEGSATSITDSQTETRGTSDTQQHLETHERIAKGAGTVGVIAGGILGTVLIPIPGVGTAIGAAVGGIAGSAVGDIGAAVTGRAGHSKTVTDSLTSVRAFTNTASEAVSRQLAGGGFGSLGMTWTRTTNLTIEGLNRKAEYCEELLRSYEKRLMAGRATGMWTVGHYFCSEHADTYQVGQSLLRALFSGMESSYEPPRITTLPGNVTTLLRCFANIYLTFPNERLKLLFGNDPPKGMVCASHPLGMWFNGLGTPLSTPELAISTPMPMQETEGISVTRRAPFGVNPPAVREDQPSLTIGQVLDHGDPTMLWLRLSLENLPKHLGVFGLTGSGKTTTMRRLLRQLWEIHRVPFMVIEPAKAEYRGLTQDAALADELAVITAGVESAKSCPLRLNPFSFTPPHPSDEAGTYLQTHIDRLRAIFNASFPMYASMPYLLEEALTEIYLDKGWDPATSLNRHLDTRHPRIVDYFPTFSDLHLKIDAVVKNKGYWIEQEQNLSAALKTRIASLMTGAKGRMLNCRRSCPDELLFKKPVVVELRHLGDDDEKTFVMGLLLVRLYEYREGLVREPSSSPPALNHLLVIEEAHRLLADVDTSNASMEGSNMRGKGVASFIDMLSEIRAYGQGVAVVDQVPGRLHPYVVKGTGTKIAHRLLAKDDREMVGHTMGLNEHQMEDLGLLECGQCVVHQDGVRKAFLCKVPAPESRWRQDNPSPPQATGTAAFRNRLTELGCLEQSSPVTSMELEAVHRLHDDVQRIMAVAAVLPLPQIQNALASLRNLLISDGVKAEEVEPLILQFWKQISEEIYAFHGGNYSSLLGMQDAGMALLRSPSAAVDDTALDDEFHESCVRYYGVSRQGGVGTPGLITRVYDQLISRHEVLVALASYCGSSQGNPDGFMEVLANGIVKEMRGLFPVGIDQLPRMLISELASTITNRAVKNISHRDRIVTRAIELFEQNQI